ncbi:MAG: hypothetical protein JSR52_06320 [Planctomycetes bacterium]|nr:hypothetical protein [Planctomycetota bacterium]
MTPLLVGAALAADPGADETSTPLPAPITHEPEPWEADPSPLLAGPRLEEDAADRTLVKFDFGGGLRRLDLTPEEAALDALNLDAETRARVDAIVREHRTFVEGLLRNDILSTLSAARKAGIKGGALVEKLSSELQASGEGGSFGRFRDRIDGALPDPERREFHRLVDEYLRALVVDEMQQSQTRKEKISLSDARVRVTLAMAGNELRRAFERQFNSRPDQCALVLAAVAPQEDQNPAVRKEITDLKDRTKNNPGGRDWFELVVRNAPSLSGEQKASMLDLLLGLPPLTQAQTSGNHREGLNEPK